MLPCGSLPCSPRASVDISVDQLVAATQLACDESCNMSPVDLMAMLSAFCEGSVSIPDLYGPAAKRLALSELTPPVSLCCRSLPPVSLDALNALNLVDELSSLEAALSSASLLCAKISEQNVEVAAQVEAPVVWSAEPEPTDLMLTAKERRRARHLARVAAARAKQDAVKVGLVRAPATRVRLANMARVYAEQFASNPTALESAVVAATAARAAAHAARNAARRVTREERRRRAVEARKARASGGPVGVCVVRVPLSDCGVVELGRRDEEGAIEGGGTGVRMGDPPLLQHLCVAAHHLMACGMVVVVDPFSPEGRSGIVDRWPSHSTVAVAAGALTESCEGTPAEHSAQVAADCSASNGERDGGFAVVLIIGTEATRRKLVRAVVKRTPWRGGSADVIFECPAPLLCARFAERRRKPLDRFRVRRFVSYADAVSSLRSLSLTSFLHPAGVTTV